MIDKLTYSLLIATALSCFTACNDIDEPDPDPDPVVDPVYDAFDLSADEMANCYIVTRPGVYRFTADNQFNLGEGLPVPPAIDPRSAALVWQSQKGSVAWVDFTLLEDMPVIVFEVTEPIGNAVIAALDGSGKIVWSWHIWMPLEEIESFSSATGYEVMNMNLGAMNNNPGDAESYGMLYQWGRKDPFPASPTLLGTTSTVGAPVYDIEGDIVKITNSSWDTDISNSIEYSIAHPTICLSNYSHYSSTRDWLQPELSDDTLWGNPEGDYHDRSNDTFPNKGRKTCYDPCPPGWRVPPVDVFRNFTSSGGYAWTFDEFNIFDYNNDGLLNLADYDYGWHFMLDSGTPIYFPAAARFDGSYAMLMGSVSGLWGNYWSNSPYSTMSGGAFCPLAFQVKDQTGKDMVTVSPAAASSRADAFSIRCIRDL